jgi:hypothetical protein
MTSELGRLRRANPFPVPAIAGDADLFARIVALPQERPPRTGRHRVVTVAIAFAAVALLASTAYAISSILGDAIGPKEVQSEYHAAQTQLQLPPGVTWPKLHLASGVTGKGAGGGHAVVIAQNAWECYWVHAIRTGDTAAGAHAHAELNAILRNDVIVTPKGASENWTPPNPPKHPFAVFADDGGYQYFQRVYAQAAAGHPQLLASSCKGNRP